MNDDVSIRPAIPNDVGVILEMVRELADYEKLLHECVANEEQFQQALFGEKPAAEALLGEIDGDPVAVARFFHNISTFMGKPGLYLEDLYVKPPFRGRGLGKAFLRQLAKVAVERGCGRFEWAVLDWNEPAVRTYDAIGAESLDDWTIRRLEGTDLHMLAKEA